MFVSCLKLSLKSSVYLHVAAVGNIIQTILFTKLALAELKSVNIVQTDFDKVKNIKMYAFLSTHHFLMMAINRKRVKYVMRILITKLGQNFCPSFFSHAVNVYILI